MTLNNGATRSLAYKLEEHRLRKIAQSPSRSLGHKFAEYMHTTLLQKRNEKMAARIIDLIKKKPDAYFFAFGAAHFMGEDNIPDIIRSSGFSVDHIQ